MLRLIHMKNLILILFASFFVSISCSKQDSPSISKKDAIGIFQNLKKVEPTKIIIATINGTEKIVCLAKKTGPEDNPYSDKYVIYILTKFADTWRVEAEKEIISLEYETIGFDELDFELTEIEDKQYLYFIYITGNVGSALSYSNFNFSLVSLSDLTISKLVYQEIGDERDFINLDDFKNKPLILKYLEEKAANSEYVHKPSAEDLDMNNPKNFEKKWAIDNPNISTVWDGNTALNNFIKVTFYDENIFPKEGDVSFSKIENSRFVIVTLFRNNILGFDKVKKQYFPIWVENCSHDCNKDIEFVGSNKLKIIYSEFNGATIIVDLNTFNFEIQR